MPASGRWPSITHANRPATAGITQNSIDTVAAPWRLIARTYIVMHSVALSSTTAATAATACDGLCTVSGENDASTTTGPMHAAFCSVAVTRKSTPTQNRC